MDTPVRILSFFIKYLLFTLFFISYLPQNVDAKQRVNFVLLGATGDLAKRYLWKGFFELFSSLQNSHDNTELRFFGGTRVDKEKGSKTLMDILNTSIKCSNTECDATKDEFIKNCMYHRLKYTEDFEDLEKFLESSSEIGRIFYLSVPPFAYEQISKDIADKCRPKSPNTWIRVVLEKPFGNNLKTAKDLAEKLSRYWNENEIYRIDHYLGKAGVTQIMDFKRENPEFFENMWNRDYIEQVNIVMKERLDASGRMGFYDEYGVIQDVFQNHLTEILALVASEISENNSEKEHLGNPQNSRKSALLTAVKPVTIHDGVYGQYEQYNTQLKQELPNVGADSNTLTFSAVLMEIQNKRWAGVPFILLSGKSLDSRLAYVKIRFKQQKFCVNDNLNNKPENCEPREFVFYIQGDDVRYPLTMLSKSMPNVKFSNNWLNLTLDSKIKSQFKNHDIIMKPSNTEYDAYSSLIREVYLGNQEKFVNVDDLLMSWKIWDQLIEASAFIQPRLYTKETLENIDFEIVNGKIEFVSGPFTECEKLGRNKYTVDDDRSRSFRGNRLVSGHSFDVAQQLANDVAIAIERKIPTNSIFHLALSGGSTPKTFFEVLALMKHIPWDKVHVWLVDERCVNPSHDDSNFGNIYKILLKNIPIPYFNIHPMLADVAGELCKPDDFRHKHYERQLRYHLVNGSLDFVVLGVGNDGHTASLSPGSSSLESANWIELTSSFQDYDRMTMTFPLLNRAKSVAVLILGQTKREIIQKLMQDSDHTLDLPITAINPVNGSMTWYVDNDALDYQT